MKVYKRFIDVFEDGWYLGRIKDIQEVEGRFGKNIKVVVELDTTPTAERLIYLPEYFTEKNKTGKFLRVMGFNLEQDEIDIDDCKGKKIAVYISNVKQGNRTVARITDFAPAVEEKKVEESAEKVRKVFKNATAINGTK